MKTPTVVLLSLLATAAAMAVTLAVAPVAPALAAQPAPAALEALAPGTGGTDAPAFSVPLSDPARPATLKVSLVNGSITVEGYGGSQVLIDMTGGEEPEGERPHGTEGMRRIPNRSRRLSVDEQDNVVRVEGRGGDHSGDLHIKVPFHTSLHLAAVNGGEIRVSGVEGEIELSHVNGGIVAHNVSGSVVAHTTNGSVKVTLQRVTPNQPMAFSTLNGDIDVTFPPDLKANVRVRSDRGEIYSDFELAARGQPVATETHPHEHRHIELRQDTQGAIGGGGPEILFKTFNGDVFIRRAHG